ncbi:MAG: hypothetical protein JWR75_1307 [Devosia sp.]|nr:hypothetical protein [Devosia sp.]
MSLGEDKLTGADAGTGEQQILPLGRELNPILGLWNSTVAGRALGDNATANGDEPL